MSMKNFNVKQSGSEVILEEVNPFKRFKPLSSKAFNPLSRNGANLDNQYIDNPDWLFFEPAVLTSIDPNIKVGQVIREDQLEISQGRECQSCGSMNTDLVTKNCLYCNDCGDNSDSTQVAKLKQPVHETPKSGHDLETCTEKEVDRVETPIHEDVTEKAQFILDVLSVYENDTYRHDWSEDYMDRIDVEIKLIKADYANIRTKSFELASNKSRLNFLTRQFQQPIPVQEHKHESEENLKQLSNITTEEYITISNIYYGKNNGTWKQGYFIMKDFESGKIKCNWLTVVEIFNFLKIRGYNLNTNIIALNSLIEDKNMEKDLFYKLVGMVGNWLTLEPKVAHEMYSEFKKQGFEITWHVQ